MELNFANPMGFWALLGIPAVIAIHFLQRKSQTLAITTLFLLDQMQRESVSGNRFERLRSSIPLWLQLLMVAIIAWILSEPRWLRRDSVQNVAVVLDNSASMTVFQEDGARVLRETLAPLATTANRTDYILLESTSRGDRLYGGDLLDDLIASLATAWEPRFGAHDPAPALQTARSLTGPTGIVIYLTDHIPDSPLPFNAKLLAVGRPTPNVGFAGLQIIEKDGQSLWTAIIRNYSDQPAARNWWLEAGSQRTSGRSVTLDPHQTIAIQGPFIEGVTHSVVRMDGDAFPLDDQLPMVLPKPKPLALDIAPGLDSPEWTKLFATFRHTFPATADSPPDLTIQLYRPLDPALPNDDGIVILRDPRKDVKFSAAAITAENHPLVESLNWQSLIARESIRIPAVESDDVLIWQGDTPLAFVRSSGPHRQLCFNFDPEKSNAFKLPAFVVTLHRFLESIRSKKAAGETVNVETGQDLAFAFDPANDAPELTLRTRDRTGEAVEQSFPLIQASMIDSPARPGFFQVFQGDSRLLDAAAHFADVREADFQSADSEDGVSGVLPSLVEETSTRDSLWRIWLLVLLAALAGSWWWSRSARDKGARSTNHPIPNPTLQQS